MASANHIGKIVITVDQNTPVESVISATMSFDADGTYLVYCLLMNSNKIKITGGLGSLGITVAQWLAWRNAKKIALIDIPIAQEPADALSKIRACGAEVSVHRCRVILIHSAYVCRQYF